MKAARSFAPDLSARRRILGLMEMSLSRTIHGIGFDNNQFHLKIAGLGENEMMVKNLKMQGSSEVEGRE
jgi:hypothetical protein